VAESVPTWQILNLTEQKKGRQLHVTVIPGRLALQQTTSVLLSLFVLWITPNQTGTLLSFTSPLISLKLGNLIYEFGV